VKHLIDLVGTLWVMVEMQGFIHEYVIEQREYECPYVVHLPEEHMSFDHILLYCDAAAKLVVDKAIW
jgi:hypothetical protein